MGDTRVHALKGIDLDIKKGEFAAIGGPSGSGKSTLLNICGMIDTADSGLYLLNGELVSEMSAVKLTQFRRDKIGFIFQNFNLIPVMTAQENVEYPLMLLAMKKQQRQQMVDKMMQKVGLNQYAHHLPDKLSGGQRQRVAIARALIKNPTLVIADEPTANLDTETANQVIDLMHDLAAEHKTTFLIATHDERMLDRCHKKLQLTDGVIQ